MCEVTRYHLYFRPAGPRRKVDPRILRYHPCREILNLSESLAKQLLDGYDPKHAPIRVHNDIVVDGSRRVQAAVYLGIKELEVATV
jgi:hypothetical protein